MVEVLRYICHKILPLVYDDSLSYYEMLCKVVNKVNEVVEELNTAEGNIAVYKEEIDQIIDDMNDGIDAFETSVNTEITNFKNEVNGEIEDFEDGTNTRLAEFQTILDSYLSIIRDETDSVLNEWADNGTLEDIVATIGRATSLVYGTVKLSDDYTATGTAINGLAPSQKALSDGLALKVNISELFGSSIVNAELGLDGGIPYIFTEANPSSGAYIPSQKYCKVYFNANGGTLRAYSADGENWNFSEEHATGMSFGIVKLSDLYTDEGGSYAGLAPSQYALKTGLATRVEKSTFFGTAISSASVYSMTSTGAGSTVLGVASADSFFIISEKTTVNNVDWYKVYSFGAQTVGFIQASMVRLITDEVGPTP